MNLASLTLKKSINLKAQAFLNLSPRRTSALNLQNYEPQPPKNDRNLLKQACFFFQIALSPKQKLKAFNPIWVLRICGD